MDTIALSLFASRISAICDEMGAVLRRGAFSPNIKDRLDFSCAIFDAAGELCAQAAHIPVHLGSMAYAMREVVRAVEWAPGHVLILNDPYLGGTHLPDVTVVSPVFVSGLLLGFVVNRAHHADIGASAPGSMPLTHRLDEEGLIIPPSLLFDRGARDEALWRHLLSHLSNPILSEGDFMAQVGACRRGIERLVTLIEQTSIPEFLAALAALNDYGERIALSALREIPRGVYQFRDVMDDDGQGHGDIAIAVTLRVARSGVDIDFNGTAGQSVGNINCPLSVAAAGAYYVFRCLMPDYTPACAGTFRPLRVRAPRGCVVNARRPAAVAAGNVETSTRVVDAVLGALAQALPDRIPAASHGSMNNLAMGARGANRAWDYYETIGGGMGAGPRGAGLSGVQTHMTNTLNTPIESLEMHYPLRVTRYALRRGSGGSGAFRGGDGLIREFEFLEPAQVTLLTERRIHAPWGLHGGAAAKSGVNRYDGNILPGKTTFIAEAGKRLSVETPGGGGWGKD